MRFRVDHLPESVGQQLQQYYRRKRLFALARVLMITALLFGILALVAMHIDRFVFLSRSARLAICGGTFAASGILGLALLIRFFMHCPSPREIAYELESKLPREVEERFVSLEDILRHTDESVQDEVGEKLLEDLTNSAIAHSGGLAPASLVTDGLTRYLFRGCLLLALVYALLFLPRSYQFGLMGKRFLVPWRDLPKASFVKLSVSPENAVLGRGGELVIQAESHGKMPAPVKWLLERLGGSSRRCFIATQNIDEGVFRYGKAQKVEMSRVHRTLFLHSATDLQKSFRYRVRYADAQTKIMGVEVVKQPEVA
ncbi:MAG: hypothetical protein KGZ25_11030, partial [Planctomycetes bacterium]|nr:hypothetical protein [Planctomycetota bacterium]